MDAGTTRVLPLHDRERLGDLFASLEPRLTAVALGITRHPDSARDVVQNAFEKVLRHGDRFAGESRVATWVHRIVANEALMWLRAQRRRADGSDPLPERDAEAIADPASGPAERLQRRERAARLYAGLARLDADERDVMMRCALAGETYREYGARTGTQTAAVKSRAFRARRQLRSLLIEPRS